VSADHGPGPERADHDAAPDGGIPWLFRRWPGLRGRLPWTSLGDFPTPVARLAATGERLGHPRLYVKRDDLSGRPYGGNKVRKLEFTLADARARGCDTVVTFGAAGSNHVLATTVHGRRLGLRTVAVLADQAPQAYVRRNLLADQGQGLEPIPARGPLDAALRGFVAWARLRATGARPCLLPPGGSSVVGTLGYVEAALEIEAQVRAGLLPAPELVVVPAGTCGTLAGLVAGLALTDLPTRVVGVRVYGRSGANPTIVRRLAGGALALLHALDAAVPTPDLGPERFVLRDDWFGPGYARFTPEGEAAVRLAAELEGLALEGTYSGKAFAAFLDLMSAPARRDRPALFVATHNSQPLGPLQDGAAGPAALPGRLARYFELPDTPVGTPP
jgi:1-aminocyclopropane-1-carboxylate deaminase/D-cysteine desulfhydrase-like pyridoxal-dependent ACC family enzyme